MTRRQNPHTDAELAAIRKNNLTKIAMVVGGVAVVGGVGYLALRKKPETAPTAAPPPPPGPPVGIDAQYSAAPAVALNAATLPVLRPASATTLGSSYWVFGDETAAPFAEELKKYAGENNLEAAASSSVPADASTPFLTELGAQIAQGHSDKLPPADVWIGVLGPQQAAGSVGAMQESLQQVRKAFPLQRILWVLTKSVPANVAHAVSAAQEEWFRSSFDDPAIVAMEAAKAAMAPDVMTINAAFPPPAPAHV